MRASTHVFPLAVAILALAAPGKPDRIPGPAGGSSEAWVEATPLENDGPARVAIHPAPPSRISVDAGLWVVCAGARQRATVCERVTGPTSISLTPAVGVPIAARIIVGRAPARGAVIELLLDGLSSRRPFTVPLARSAGGSPERRVLTQAGGRVMLPALAPGQYRLQLSTADGGVRVSEPFAVPVPERVRSGDAAPHPSLELGEIVFDEGALVAVTVLDGDGAPLAGVSVAGLQPSSGDSPPIFASTTTSAMGLAELRGYALNRPVGLTFRKEGYAEQRQEFDDPPTSLEVRLRRLARLSGSVVDAAGHAVEGALVSVREPTRSVTSGRDGSFSVRDLSAGDYTLVARGADLSSEEINITIEAGEEARIPPLVLLPSIVVEGFVRDAGNRKPVAGATLRSIWPVGALDTTTDGEGRFSLRVGSGAGSSVTIEVTADEYPATTIGIPAPPPDGAPLTIDLRKGGRIRAEAWDEDADRPCGGCSFTVQRPDGTGVLLTADAAGAAESPLLTPGRHRVVLEWVRATGAVVEVRGGDNARDVQVESGVVATVRFGERKAILHVRFTSPIPAGWLLVTRDPGGQRVWPLQPDGSYRVLRSSVAPEMVVYLSNGQGTQVFQGTVPPGYEQPSIEFQPSDASVWGLLTAPDGRARGGVPLVLRQPAGAVSAWVLTQPDGRFEVPYLRPGWLDVIDGATVLGSFALAARENKDLGALSSERP